MDKIKSAISLVLITILLAGLCFMSTAVFPYGTGNIKMFNGFITMTEKDSKLGNSLPEGYTTSSGKSYIGGGYTAVYYPDGVISAREFADNLAGLNGEEAAEYEERYVRYPDDNGNVYLEKEIVYGENGTEVSDAFKADFETAMKQLRIRVDAMHLAGTSVSVRNDYTAQISLPAYQGSFSTLAFAFTTFANTGEFSMGYLDGSEVKRIEDEAEFKDGDKTIADYVSSVSSTTNTNGSYVEIRFTNAGKALLSKWTENAESSAVTLYFYVGDETLISLSVTEHVNQKSLYVSGSYDSLAAKAVAATLNSSIKGNGLELTFELGEIVRNGATFGDLAFILLCAGTCVLFLAAVLFFFIKFRGIGLANLYTMATYLLLMILLVWAIPFLHVGVETFLAIALGGVLLAACNFVTYESAKKEFALGKTMTASVKAGYKRCFFGIFDLHVALALIAFIAYFIAFTELAAFAFTLGIAVVLSGLCTLAVSRFHWAAFMSFAKNKGKFCNFKRVEDDDE